MTRELPEALKPLVELALDLRWTWSHAADALWRSVDEATWEATRNPWRVLMEASDSRLSQLSVDAPFLNHLVRVVDDRWAYLNEPAWCSRSIPGFDGELVAYFCMEFGLGEAIPLYAGGLGILAGDFLKAASDLGVPTVGVGVLYQEGYFRQLVDRDGRQQEAYPYNDPTTLPIEPLRAADGAWRRVPLELPGRTVWLRAWLARVGRVSLYLLDANDPQNLAADRGITAKLYGGGSEMRLLQELVLGVGGWRLLRALGLQPTLTHLNEGHAAFAVLERAQSFMRERSVSFAEALVATRAANVFTTHTPVASGFDRFDPELVRHNLLSTGSCLSALAASEREVLAMGRANVEDDREPFNMAYLAIRGCASVNAVSKLHGEVSRHLFAGLFRGWPVAEVPIRHVTNGVHVPSWDSPAADALWTRACGKRRWRGSVDTLEAIVAGLDDGALWSLRSEQRLELVTRVRGRLARQLTRVGVDSAQAIADHCLDPNALTLGFARRFAEYKRPNLLLSDPDRLARLLTNGARPAQLVIAGKAHPADDNGKRMIAEWVQFARRPEMRARVVFLEDYDITLAEELTQGADVWLNTPRRPWEACGTSGMKVLVNGGLNLSERDGWWAEADAPDVGWGLSGSSDEAEASLLYETLEQQVLPEFYERDSQGIPRAWLARVRASMARLAPRFSANRMLREYVEEIYVLAAAAARARNPPGANVAREIVQRCDRLARTWHDVRFGALDVSRERELWRFRVGVTLGDVPPEWIRAELWADGVGNEPPIRQAMTPLAGGEPGEQRFEARIASPRSSTDFTPRLIARHDDAQCPAELPFIRWQR